MTDLEPLTDRNEEPKTKDPEKWASYISYEIGKGQDRHKKYYKQGRRAEDSYFADRAKSYSDWSEGETNSKVQMFWANVETLKPIIYNAPPQPDIRRRRNQSDVVAKVSAQILEGATEYSLDIFDFDYYAQQIVRDRLVPGRACGKVRYSSEKAWVEEKIALYEQDGVYYTADGQIAEGQIVRGDPDNAFYIDKYEKVVNEQVVCDYVPWTDVLHNKARNWNEIAQGGWIAFRVHLSKKEANAKFGKEYASELKYVHKDDEDTGNDDSSQEGYRRNAKAPLWEFWHEPTRKVYYWSESSKETLLAVEDDPLGLKDFFPCPRFLQATTTSRSYLPKPDRIFYEDQLSEIDNLTTRIDLLVDSLRVVGVCDRASFGELHDLLERSNEIVPVDNWVEFQKAGGFNGVVQFMPVGDLAATLDKLYMARDKSFDLVYMVLGMPDIMRGVTDAQESAAAQSKKAAYAQRRISSLQREVARFLRDSMALMVEIIAEKFSPDTLKRMGGTEFEDDIAPEQVEAAIEMMRDDVTRNYRIDIETDSTIAIDEDAERENRGKMLGEVIPFIDKLIDISERAPAYEPAFSRILQWTVRGNKVGRNVEDSVEQSIKASKEQREAAAQQPPQPDPEMMKLQIEQGKLQLEQMKVQQKAQFDSQKLQLEQQKAQQSGQIDWQELQIKIQQMQADLFKMQKELEMKERELQTRLVDEQQQSEKVATEAQVAVMKAQTDAEATRQKTAIDMRKLETDLAYRARELEIQERAAMVKESEVLIKAKSEGLNPDGTAEDKIVEFIRDADGKLIGAKEVKGD